MSTGQTTDTISALIAQLTAARDQLIQQVQQISVQIESMSKHREATSTQVYQIEQALKALQGTPALPY